MYPFPTIILLEILLIFSSLLLCLTNDITDTLIEIVSAIPVKSVVFVAMDVDHGPDSSFSIKRVMRTVSAAFLVFSRSGFHLAPLTGGEILLMAIINRNNALTAQQIVWDLLESIRSSKVIFICESGCLSILDEFLKVCWDSDMSNVVMLAEDPVQIFTYNPFEIPLVRNLTTTKNPLDLFYNKFLDLQGEPFRVIFEEFSPHAFLYTNRKGELAVGGFSGRTFLTYTRKRNATPIYLQYKKNDYRTEISNLFGNGSLEMAVHIPVAPEDPNFIYDNIASYVKWCALVPAPKKIPIYLNFVQPFQDDVWALIIFGMIYSTLVLHIATKLTEGSSSLALKFLESLKLLLRMATIEHYRKINKKYYFVFLPIFLFGLILSQLYLIYLASFLTTPLWEKGIKTLDDIRKANLRILGVKYDVERNVLSAKELKDYHDLVEIVSMKDLLTWRKRMNNTNVIMSFDDKIHLTLLRQVGRPEPKFSNPGICFGTYAYTHAMKLEFRYKSDYYWHILMVAQAGFRDHWYKGAYAELVGAGLIKRAAAIDNRAWALSIDHLKLIFIILASGLVLSGIVFIVELQIRICKRSE
ncbi:unnamed protein product [Hermetia illucens]|uniref:Ionotropic receptor n=1 Tax=Hermetia illucens TaxID=343691 RepID=A0A7R8YPI2_HERIL|nr:uncharacterized protein LOC119647670 [Hermetia illucens]CAD7080673.1 unnamed protein product [Hermetia illucens]